MRPVTRRRLLSIVALVMLLASLFSTETAEVWCRVATGATIEADDDDGPYFTCRAHAGAARVGGPTHAQDGEPSRTGAFTSPHPTIIFCWKRGSPDCPKGCASTEPAPPMTPCSSRRPRMALFFLVRLSLPSVSALCA